METVPLDNPVNTPPAVMLPREEGEQLQVPPVVTSANVAGLPMHSVSTPVITAGIGLTVMVLVT